MITQHTVGYANIASLEKVVKNTKPNMIIPIHTFCREKFAEISPAGRVIQINDG